MKLRKVSDRRSGSDAYDLESFYDTRQNKMSRFNK